MDDVLKGLFINVPPGYVACVYDLGKWVLKKFLLIASSKDTVLAKANYLILKLWNIVFPDSLIPNMKKLWVIFYSCWNKRWPESRVEGTVLLRLDVHQVPSIWQTIGEDFIVKIIRPTIRSRVRMVFSKFGLSRNCGCQERFCRNGA